MTTPSKNSQPQQNILAGGPGWIVQISAPGPALLEADDTKLSKAEQQLSWKVRHLDTICRDSRRWRFACDKETPQ